MQELTLDNNLRRLYAHPLVRPLRRIWGKRRRNPLRRITGGARLLPDFVIIGAQKSGTGSLYYDLCRHPAIHAACLKEVHYFDLHYGKGVGWYRSHFPFAAQRKLADRVSKGPFLTGEASPYYVFEPRVPQRLFRLLPQAKLIMLLRNPVTRAYSHYNHEVRAERENLSFEAALEAEEGRLAGEADKLFSDEAYTSWPLQRYSYVARGRYAEQLRSWFELFDREQFLLIKSEGFFESSWQVLDRVWQFLGVPSWRPKSGKLVRHGLPNRYGPMQAKTFERLSEYFRPHNEALYDLTGSDFNW